VVTITDVAHKARVSIATVSRVINTPEQVNEKMRNAVLQVIEELNYRPNRAAQALKRQESHTIGFALSHFSAPYYGKVLDGIDEALVEVNFKTIAENGRETAESQVEAWMSLLERQCESVIAVFSQNDVMATGVMEACEKHGISIPDQMSILGYDDLDLARYVKPKLTTIRQPLHQIGRAAALLAHRLCRPNAPATTPIQTRFEGRIIERETVAKIAI